MFTVFQLLVPKDTGFQVVAPA